MNNARQDDERVRKILAVQAGFIASMGRAVRDRFGEEGLEAIRQEFFKTQSKYAPIIARRAGVQVENGGIEDWIKFQSYLSRINNLPIKSESSPTRGRMLVTECPMAEQFRRIYPEFCRLVYIAVEEATVKTINPRMEVKWIQLLPEGGDACELICELKPEK